MLILLIWWCLSCNVVDVIFEELLVEFVNVEVICIKFIEISGLDSFFWE